MAVMGVPVERVDTGARVLLVVRGGLLKTTRGGAAMAETAETAETAGPAVVAAVGPASGLSVPTPPWSRTRVLFTCWAWGELVEPRSGTLGPLVLLRTRMGAEVLTF